MANPVTETADKVTGGNFSKGWNFLRNTTGLLAISTAFAVATGGVSLAADPTAASAITGLTAETALGAGSSVAATSGSLVGLSDVASMTIQGLSHNLGLAIDGLQMIPGVS